VIDHLLFAFNYLENQIITLDNSKV